MPQRIQRQRTAGWRMPAGAVYVGRPTKWGNPFSVEGAREVGYVGTDTELRAMCVARYRAWMRRADLADRDSYWSHDGRQYDRVEVRSRASELVGRDLVCWCPLDQPCHADALLELAAHVASDSAAP